MSSARDGDHGQFDLVGLIAGELGRNETIAVGHHLRSCPQCTEELVDLAVAHGALSAASAALVKLDSAPTDRPRPNVPLAYMPGHDEELPTPARIEFDTTKITKRITAPKRLAVVAAVAAAVLIFVGVGTLIPWSQSPPSTSVVANAALKPIDAPASATGSVRAVAVGDTRNLTVETKNLKALSDEQFYEVWMLNTSTQKMLPVGVLPPSGTGTYSMGASIMSGYSAVDISLQTNNGNPAHSTTSVLRATFSSTPGPRST